MFKIFKPKTEFSKNVLTLISGASIAQAIPIAISPVLTRIYTPEDFGVFALFVAFVGFISVVASGRYEQAVMLPKYDKYAINVLTLSFILIFITTFLLVILIFFLKDEIFKLFNNDLLGKWIYFVPVTVFFIAIFNLLTNYNNRTKHYKDIANATVIKSIVSSVLQLLIGVMKAGPAGLIIGQVMAQFFANFKLAGNILKSININNISKERIIVQARKYKNFPKYNMPHALFNTISASLPIFFFTAYFTSEVVGYYSLALMIVLSPLMIIAKSTARVYNQKVVEMFNCGGNIYNFTLKTIQSLIFKITIPFLVFVLIAPQLFSVVFGSEWYLSGIYLQILSPYVFLIFIVTMVSYLPSLYGKQKISLSIEIIYFALKIISLFLGCIVFNDVELALAFYAFVSIIVLGFNLKWFLDLTRRG